MHLHHESLGSGPDWVCLHGLFGDGGNLRRLAGLLAAHCRVHVLDLRNHGRSPWADDMSWAAMAADVLETVQALGISRFILLGHSLGGKVAMQLACEQPERVQALTVLDIAPVAYAPGHQKILAGLTDLQQKPPGSREEAAQRLAHWVPDALEAAFLLKNLQRQADGHYGLRCHLTAIREQYPNLIAAPDIARPYQGRALFLRGAHSRYVQAEGEAAIHRAFPQACIETVANTGHWLHFEQAEAVASALRRFL